MPATLRYSPLRTEIAGVGVEQLARQFGTPTYVYDAAKIVERIGDLQAFDDIRYAQKACSNLAILDLMRRHGVLVDAVSAGEIRRALAAGYGTAGDVPPIVYTADIFDREALELVVERNIHVNCGSRDMIEQLGNVAPGRDITLRLNPGFGHGHSQKTNTGGEQSKHGIWHTELVDCLRLADHHGLGVSGLHMHIGSGTDLEHLAQVCGALEQAAREVGARSPRSAPAADCRSPIATIRRTSISTRTSSCGTPRASGWKTPSATRCDWRSSQGDTWWRRADIWWPRFGRSSRWATTLFICSTRGSTTWPGRSCTAPITRCRSCPAARAARSGRCTTWWWADRCANRETFSRRKKEATSRTRSLPLADVGEYLVIECAGAYGFVMGSNYNAKPLAAEVLIEGGSRTWFAAGRPSRTWWPENRFPSGENAALAAVGTVPICSYD